MAAFEIADLGKLSHFLGLEFNQVQKGVFMQKPRISHMQAAKRVLRFVKGTIDNSVLFLFEVG